MVLFSATRVTVLRYITFPCLGSIERQSIWLYSYNWPMFVMKLLGMNMRMTGQHGPAIWEVGSSSPGRAYVLISEDVAISIFL